MKFYLSSYKIGSKNNILKLKKLFLKFKKIAFIPNALDFSNDLERKNNNIYEDISDLKKLGAKIKILDLKNYFNNKEKLKKDINLFQGIWVCGGNVFVLRQSFYFSGIDKIIKNFWKQKKEFFYGGYSAGVCILSKNLKWLNLVDNPKIYPYKPYKKTIWSGLGILDYLIIPHYQSNHPESPLIEKLVKELREKNIYFKTLKDGDVIIL